MCIVRVNLQSGGSFMQNSLKSRILVLFMLFGMSGHHMNASNTGEKMLIGAAIGAAAVGVASLISWATSESDDQLLNNTRQQYQNALNTFNPFIIRLKTHFGVAVPTSFEIGRVSSSIDEVILYEFALEFWKTKTLIANYNHELSNAISSLQNRRAVLRERMSVLRDMGYVDVTARIMIDSMREMVESIEQATPWMELLRDFFYSHKSYYQLFETEAWIRNRYGIELEAVKSFAYDRIAVEREVSRAIMVRQTQEGWSYPIMAYLAQLDSDLNSFESAMRKVKKSYRERMAWASQAYDSLKYIRSMVATSIRYVDEFNERERSRLERQQVELRQREMEAYKRELHILEEQNRLKRQELALEEQRLRERYASHDYADIKASITFSL